MTMQSSALFDQFCDQLPENVGWKNVQYCDNRKIKVDVITGEGLDAIYQWVKAAGGKVISSNPINGGYNVWFWPMEEAQNRRAKKAGK